MKYRIDKKSNKSIYIQLYEMIRQDIVDGFYKHGTKIPSKRLVSEETGVSVVSVEHAYALLCDEGYIEPRERSGYYVCFKIKDNYAVGNGEGLVNIKIAPKKHDFDYSPFPFSVISKTMRKVIADYGDTLLERSPNEGVMDLRKAICGYLARNRGITVSYNQIIIGSGAEYLYGRVIDILGRNKIYAIETPSYKKIEQVYMAAGVKCRKLHFADDGIVSFELACTDAEVLHVTPYRSFPTGITASASKRMEYIGWASKGDKYIIEDDFQSEFTLSKKSEETIFSLSKNENVIYLNTFSQTISPALRTGYMVLPKRLVPAYKEKAGFYSCSVPTFEQFLIAALINSGDFERHINKVRRLKRKNII